MLILHSIFLVGQTESDSYYKGYAAGKAKGVQDGQANGSYYGYWAGYNKCYADQKGKQYNAGYNLGYKDGQAIGYQDGTYYGKKNGAVSGKNDGIAAGKEAANANSRIIAEPEGRLEGIQLAENSSAAIQGQNDGETDGRKSAYENAVAKDFPAGRSSYYSSVMDSEIIHREMVAINAKPVDVDLVSSPQTLRSDSSAQSIVGQGDSLLDGMISNEQVSRGDIPKQANDVSYDKGYKAGYNEVYNYNYKLKYNEQWYNGCSSANKENYSSFDNQGYNDGKNKGYESSYNTAYADYYKYEYNITYNDHYTRSYNEHYNYYYRIHYDKGKETAFKDKWDQLYRSAFRLAQDSSFDQHYPGYAKSEFDRGWQSKMEEMDRNPIQIINAELVESISNGVFEPYEELVLKVTVRNTSNRTIMGEDVVLDLQSSNDLWLSKSMESIPIEIEPQSLYTFTEVFYLAPTTVSIGKKSVMEVFVKYKDISENNSLKLNFHTDYILHASAINREEVIQEGMSSLTEFSIQNISNRETDSLTILSIKSNDENIILKDTLIQLGSIDSGSIRNIDLFVTSRMSAGRVNVDFECEIRNGNGRVIEQTTLNKLYRVYNEYQIENIKTRRKNKRDRYVTTVTLYLVNAKSDSQQMDNLQMKLRFPDEQAGYCLIMPDEKLKVKSIRPLKKRKIKFKIQRKDTEWKLFEIEVLQNNETKIIRQINI